MNWEYKVTVIIPVYNVERYLEDSLKSLLAQTIPQAEMEVLMINDGSEDGSLEICERFAAAHENFKVISQENQGVSAARNAGIRNAKGKYLLYLDGDDTLSSETVKNVTDFFDEHYDEVDVVGYSILFCYEDGREVPHGRDKILNATGIYDTEEVPYVNLTTINVAVKSKGKENLLFDNALFFHEDESYLAAIVMSCKKFGYVREAKYLYKKYSGGITNRKVNPYYIFEPSMEFYEHLFETYCDSDGVSKYVQALVLNDFAWKIKQDAVYPYHYSSEKFQAALARIICLLNQVDDSLILKHPNIDVYHKFYLLSLKNRNNLGILYGENAVVLHRGADVLYVADSITVVITKVKFASEFVELQGFLKSPLFTFSEKPELFVDITADGKKYSETLSLLDSAHSYYKSKIKTNQFWRFHFRISNKKQSSVKLHIALGGRDIRYKYYFMPEVPFQNRIQNQTVSCHGTRCTIKGLEITVTPVTQEEQKEDKNRKDSWYWKRNKKFWLVRKLTTLGMRNKGRVWLYYDSVGVGNDNGFFQFAHDIRQKDGVTRYYVVHDKDTIAAKYFAKVPKEQIVLFGSKRHKFLYLSSEKIITAYVEPYNYIPFDWNTYGNYRDINEPEIIYLQHGVLHAHMPHKYSLDRLNIDCEVVSTFYEVKNLMNNYHFQKRNLIMAGMPRYDHIDADTEGSRKILMAPSWRQYLISMRNGIWEPEEREFKLSNFFKNIQAFLQSAELAEMLETYDYTLDLKLHPIFQCYQDYFTSTNSRIRISSSNIDVSQYSIFISDCSSFSYDFVYRKCALLYFFPDYDMFRAGLMTYRQLDISLEDGFGPFTLTVEDALGELKKLLENGGKPAELYRQRMENFFLFYDNGQTERIYAALTQGHTVMLKDALFEDALRADEDSMGC